MSGTALDHRLVREYLRELDTAMRGVPAAHARELRQQITAHLEDVLGPDAGDQEVAAALRRLGSPADLAAEAGATSGPSGPRSARSSPRMRWRLAAVIAVPTVIAAALGAVQISSDVSNDVTSGRDQHLAVLDAAVVKLTQDLGRRTRPVRRLHRPRAGRAATRDPGQCTHGHRSSGQHRAGGRGRRPASARATSREPSRPCLACWPGSPT